MPATARQSTENRLRRVADRAGYRLIKSRNRNPEALDHGLYALLDHETGGAVHSPIGGRTCSLALEDVEAFLREAPATTAS